MPMTGSPRSSNRRATWNPINPAARSGGSALCRSFGRTATIDVVETNDVVLAEIAAGLHLDQLERDFSQIGQTMDRTDGDVGRLVLVHDLFDLADRHFRSAAHHDP